MSFYRMDKMPCAEETLAIAEQCVYKSMINHPENNH